MKVVKRKGAFVQYADATWGIDTKVKIGDEFRHFGKKGYTTLSAAKADYERAKEEFMEANSNHHEHMFYEELVDEYLKTRSITVAKGTVYMTQSILNTYFLPCFKKQLIKDFIKKDVIKGWHLDVANNPKIGSNRKNKVIGTMRDFIKFAYMNEYVDAKVYQQCDICLLKVKENKSEVKERIAWTLEELNQFFTAIPEGSIDHLMFKLFFTTAPRISEFLALMPRCYDRKTKRISIEQQILYSYNNTGKPQLTNRLKTKDSYRTILIPDDLAKMLEEYIDDFNIQDDEFLFCGRDRHTSYAKTTFKRRLDHYCDLAGVRRINPHGARHTMAVLLSAVSHDHADIVAAARRLGHSPEMFASTYANHKNDQKEEELLMKVRFDA